MINLGTFGPIPREARGQQIAVNVTIGYIGTRFTDVHVNGDSDVLWSIPHDVLRVAVVQPATPLAGRAIALCRKIAQQSGPTSGSWAAEARAIIEELDA